MARQKKHQKQKGGTGGPGIRQVGTTKKFQPDTLTKRLEQRQSVQRHRRQNGFEQIRCLSDLVASAAERGAAFEREEAQAAQEKDCVQVKEGVKRSFYKEFRKVVSQADVVLQVLDVRDPEGCRCFDAETAVLSDYSKRLILVLNKIDLVPLEIAQAWHSHLSKQFPTVLFKANTQTQRSRLKQTTQDVRAVSHKAFSSTACLGARELTKLLVNYTRNKGIRTSIRVGVIGLPNVGKSSLINSLLRSRSCNVGAVPGVTKTVQEVLLDKKIKLLDSPGVVLAQNVGPLATIQNSVKLDSLEDPVQPIELILRYCGMDQIVQHYQIEPFETPSQLLALLAFKFGKLMGGGAPDTNAAARVLLRDWNAGSVQFYTKPPQDSSMPSHLSSAVVGDWASEFNMPESIKVEDDIRMDCPDNQHNSTPELTVVFKADSRKPEQIDKLFVDKPYEVPQLQQGKVRKQQTAALKKSRKRMDKLGDMFDSAMNAMIDCDDDSETDM